MMEEETRTQIRICFKIGVSRRGIVDALIRNKGITAEEAWRLLDEYERTAETVQTPSE